MLAMCTRFVTPDQAAAERYMAHVPDWWQQSFDVRITNQVPTERGSATGEHVVDAMYWTLLPPRSDSPKAWRLPTWNLRGERLEESRMYAPALNERRCVLPAAGFYEWPTVDGNKVRHFIHPANDEMFFFAGLWSHWHAKDGSAEQLTCGLITCEANAFMRPLHNTGKNRHRMPVILNRELADQWLFAPKQEALELVGPCPDDWLAAHPVARNLGNVPEQIEPVG